MIPFIIPPTQVVLSSSYEDHLVGVHLANKEEQDAAMQVFFSTLLCVRFNRSSSQILFGECDAPHSDGRAQEFVAGRLAAGEMGNGVLLEEMKPAEEKLRDQMYQVATFHAGNKPL